MAIEAVIFDIGNVLIEWQPERFYDAEIGPVRRRAMFAAVDLQGMNDRVDRGEPFRETVYSQAEATPEWGNEIRLWHDRWIEMAYPEIGHSVRLQRSLRAAGVPVYALSNFGVENFALAETKYPFLADFDRRFISGHMGVTKPAQRIYEIVEEQTEHRPGTLLFTDDRPENIDAAYIRGWQTHLFEGPTGWAQRLVSEGLLSEGDAQ